MINDFSFKDIEKILGSTESFGIEFNCAVAKDGDTYTLGVNANSSNGMNVSSEVESTSIDDLVDKASVELADQIVDYMTKQQEDKKQQVESNQADLELLKRRVEYQNDLISDLRRDIEVYKETIARQQNDIQELSNSKTESKETKEKQKTSDDYWNELFEIFHI